MVGLIKQDYFSLMSRSENFETVFTANPMNVKGTPIV